MAIINYLMAKKEGGSFILRIEDTDRKRLVSGSSENIMQSLEMMGLIPDESRNKSCELCSGFVRGGPFGPYVQSERLKLYRDHAQMLIKVDVEKGIESIVSCCILLFLSRKCKSQPR